MRWIEVLEDDTGRLSSTRLTVILGAIVLSAVVIIDAWNDNTNETVIGIFAAFCAGVYGLMKGFDSSVTKAEIKSTSPNKIESVTIKAEGDANVNNRT